MGSKQKTRRRPVVERVQKQHINREEHQKCITPGCRNIVAIWAKYKVCAICRAGVG